MDDSGKPEPSFSSRLLRGAGITAIGFVAAQGLRFASNLILARLLFPEAFGLMALITVFLVGAVMLSDAGIGQSVRQSPRGDEPAFLNTAWTMQALRGAFLWAVICLLAWPAAQIYKAPDLLTMMPVAGLTLLLAGLEPMRVDLAYRHLSVARVTGFELLSQAIGIAVMVALAWQTESVWSLVAGMVVTSAAKLLFYWTMLPGPPHRPQWERRAAAELYNFGIWIFLSSVFGFLLLQGDRAIFGRYLSLAELGTYNVAFFLASFPTLLAGALTGTLLLPAYRIAREEGAAAQARLRRLRFGLTGAIMLLLGVLALIGPLLIDLLYDDRYAAAGQMLVWIALMQMWPMIGMTYDQAALAAGDSRSFFWVIAARAVVQTLFFILGMQWGGLPGALSGQVAAVILVHPAVIWLARKYNVWDMRHDLAAAAFAGLAGALVLYARAGG